jgi:hypothetical protein
MDHFAGLDVSVKDTSVCSLKALDPNWPIREADICFCTAHVRFRG